MVFNRWATTNGGAKIFLSGWANLGPLIYWEGQWRNENRLIYRLSDSFNYRLLKKMLIILEKTKIRFLLKFKLNLKHNKTKISTLYVFRYILKYDLIQNNNTMKPHRVGQPWSRKILGWAVIYSGPLMAPPRVANPILGLMSF